jgi:hypothetical protein
MTSKADGYRDKARECEERAGQTLDSLIKQQLIELAQKWHTIAAYEKNTGAEPAEPTADELQEQAMADDRNAKQQRSPMA